MALMPAADALAAILAGASALPEETVALPAAHHRVLARDLAARRTQPPDDMSAMDGYAVRAADVATIPARLTVVGEAAAGRPWNQQLQAGQAVRIFTGGVMPSGADAVVIQEDTTRDGDTVIVSETAKSGRNIRFAGIDFREGDVLLPAGRRLSDRNLSLAASMNYPELPVRRRPRVAVLATGDELVPPGSTPGPGQIILSNGFALRALAENEGAETIDLGIAADTIESTTAAIRAARDGAADILISTGGASVGDHDLMNVALKAEGVEMAFWKIALRPGKPMMYGRLGPMRVIGLPGNPAASYVCAFLFMVPLLRALSGRTDVHHPIEQAILGEDVPANDQRQDYMRARLDVRDDGRTLATPVNHQDSSLLANLSVAQGLLIRPPHAAAAAAGTACPFVRLPG